MQRLLATALAALLLVGTAAAPALAQQQDGPSATESLLLVDGDGETNVVDQATQAGAVLADRYLTAVVPDFVRGITTGEGERTADELGTDISECATDNEQATLGWVNNQSATVNLSAHDTTEIVVDTDDGEATRWLVADHSNGTVDSVTMQTVEPNRTIDDTLVLDRYAAEHVCGDIEWVRDNYVQPGDEVDRKLFARFSARYAGHVERGGA